MSETSAVGFAGWSKMCAFPSLVAEPLEKAKARDDMGRWQKLEAGVVSFAWWSWGPTRKHIRDRHVDTMKAKPMLNQFVLVNLGLGFNCM